MAEGEQTVFRKKTLERISSPEQLTDYLCITNPSIWVILIAVALLLVGLFAWANIGTLETSAQVRVIVEESTAQVIPLAAEAIEVGMPLRVESQEFYIASVDVDRYGRTIALTEVTLPDGAYDGTVVTDWTRPISFLLESR